MARGMYMLTSKQLMEYVGKLGHSVKAKQYTVKNACIVTVHVTLMELQLQYHSIIINLIILRFQCSFNRQ